MFSVLNLRFKIPVDFQNGSNYDYHFIIKKISKRVWKPNWTFWRKTKKCKPFFILIEREVTKFDKDGNKTIVTISYKRNFDRGRYMASTLSNLVDNFAEGNTKLNVKIVIVYLNAMVSMTI